MATVNDVLNQARSELGYAESPSGSNKTKFSAEAGHVNGYAWCATFVVAMFRRCNLRLPSESAYTPTMANGFRLNNQFYNEKPIPGDVVFFEWPNMGRISHVGIVESATSRNDIYTIEGNTDTFGGRTGGKVMRQHRTKYIAGYGRPSYGAEFPNEENELMAAKDEIIANVNSHTSVTSAYQAQSPRVFSLYGQLHRWSVSSNGTLRRQWFDPASKKWNADTWADNCKPDSIVDIHPSYSNQLHVFVDHIDDDKVVHAWMDLSTRVIYQEVIPR